MTSIHFIHDRFGKSYRVESERGYGWSFRIWRDHYAVGYLNCIQHPPVLLVGDLRIRDDVPVFEPLVFRVARRLLGRPRPVRCYRDCGLGTAMLALLSDLAKSAGYERLEGWISDVDTDTNPGLPDWYRRRGFTVTLTPSEKSRRVATICKVL